ncbi:MAG: DsrE family protein [Acidiferrobacterales bacterium]
MTEVRKGLLSAALVSLFAFAPLAHAAPKEVPYGTAKFSAFKDIDRVKQLKVIWDFNFVDPKAVGMVFNNLAALIRAVNDYGPKEIDPLKVIVLSHGPEVVVWDRRNYAKYKDIVDRAASFAQQGVRFEVCNNDAKALGLKPKDLYGFITVIPAGPYALAYWQAKGYGVIEPGATVPTSPFSAFNKADIHKKK